MKSSIRIAKAAMMASLLLLVTVPFGCDDKKAEQPDQQKKTAAEESTEPLKPPRLPEAPEKFAPAFTTIPEGAHYDVDVHADVDSCNECHGGIVEQWKTSVHALGSFNNPYYRTSFDDFVEHAGRDKAPFCAGCHDPTLLFDGAIERPVEPTEYRAHLGVTCNTCHGIEEATVDGNGSYLLSTTYVPIPKDDEPKTLAKHIERVGGAKLRTNELCVSCHRGFLSPDTGHPVVIGGVDEFTPFHRSPYNGRQVGRISGLDEKTCVDCHMPEVEVNGKTVRSHRFPGGHTTMAAAAGSAEQLEATTKMVENAAVIDIAGWGVGDFGLNSPDKLAPGDEMWADVVVFNESTGHLFPGGAGDLRDTWVEFVVQDANGKVVAEAGTRHEETGEDDTAHVFNVLVGNLEGTNVDTHQVISFRTPVYDHRIPPRGASVVRYGWTVPEDAEIAHPVMLQARLRHRRLSKSLYDESCARSKTELGQKWRAETKFRTGLDVDPCIPQPVVDIDQATLAIGSSERSPTLDDWKRYYRWGIGLQESVSESLGEAVTVFEAARKAVDPAEKRQVAMVELVLGQVAARQGRRQDALDHFARAENLIGSHPAIDFARGKAHQRTFHNEEATRAFIAASKAVDDDRVWRQLAISAGSVFEHRTAYDAARAGLEISPRDPHLLRSQSLAAKELDVPEELAEKARDTFLAFRRDELAPEIRVRCAKSSDTCRRERVPVHVHELRTPEVIP